MAPADEYTAAAGAGKLKLKGVKDGRVEKKKKKKKEKKEGEDATADAEREASAGAEARGEEEDVDEKGYRLVGKTEAEKRYEEERRKRLDQRLKREGVKTHKERVEEFNKYLSKLSEHHDMPRIGPG
ncbi:hypothetical protein M432DRAFT_238768 [Thermoascus aurantiacus ATCC 26904]